MSGRVGDLSPKQAEVLEKFKDVMQDVLEPKHDDHFLLRWLRARDFDIKKAETMLRNSFEWRKRVGADTILSDFTPPEVLKKYYPGGLYGFDKDGFPVWVVPFGNVDLKGLLMSAKKSDVKKYVAYILELSLKLMEEQTAKLGKRIDEVSVIFDIENLNMRHIVWKPGVDLFTETQIMYEDNYPETLRKCFIVKASKIFPIAFAIIKPFMSEVTVRKLQICGSNWKDVLIENIDEDQLPVFWGGKATDVVDGNPYCSSIISMGGEIPESYYQQGKTSRSTDCMTSAVVSRGSSLQLEYEITVQHSMIRWEFITEHYDLGFGVFRRTANMRQKAGDMEAVVTTQRVNSHMVPEDGMVSCTQVGTYVVRFDNTYSWTRNKKLYYLIDILLPEEVPEMKGLTFQDDEILFSSSKESGNVLPMDAAVDEGTEPDS